MKTNFKYSILFFLIPFINFSQNSIYQEEFHNQGNWTKANNEIRELYVSNDKYYFEHKKTKGFREITTRSFTIDVSKDFEIETKIHKISGISDYGMSFIYDYHDQDNYYEFGFTSSGYFRIAKSNKGVFQNVKQWTSNSDINKGNNAVNSLKIKKIGKRITYYINDIYAYSHDFEKRIGNQIAFRLYRNQKIALDYIRVNYLESANVKTSKNNRTVLFEGFNNNSNSWLELDNDENSLKIINGDYVINRKIESGGYSSTIKKYINTSRDFRITAQIKKISGVNNNGFGIVFGRKDSGNQNQFFITSNGSFIINKTVNDKRTYVKNWTKSSAIKKGNGKYNYLKIQKKGNIVRYYINNELVHSSYNAKFYGDRVGFIVYDKIKFAVGYISIAYDDEQIDGSKSLVVKNKSHTIKESILFDGYTSNKNNWSTTSNENVHVDVSDGNYNFNHKRLNGGWSSTIKKQIDYSRDFKILTDIKKISGNLNNGYGLIFGREDSNNQNLFYVNGKGSFSINKMRNGKNNYLKNWTPSSVIRKGNGAYNVLKVVKIGTKLQYYINDENVYTDNNPTFPGNRVGYIVYDKQKISIAYISIGYLNNKTADIKNSKSNKKLIENSSNKISNYVYNDSGFHFSDQFNNNQNNWSLKNDDIKTFEIKNGKYYLSHKRNEKGWAVHEEHKIDTDENFEIETKLDKISGVSNFGYGLIFGKKGKNDFRFYISSSGYYKIANMIDSNEEIIQNWKKTPLIKTGNSKSNILKIKKQDGYYKFYINGSNVFQMDYLPFFGNELGFVIYNNQIIAIDYVRVKYLD